MLVILIGYSYFLEIYDFHRYGVEKTARVTEVVYKYRIKGSSSFETKLAVGNFLIQKDLRVQLPIGQDVSVLVMPNEPYKLTLGNRSSSIFELYFYDVGSFTRAVMILIGLTGFVIIGTINVIFVMKDKKFTR